MKSNLGILVRSNFQMLWGSMRYSKRKKKYIPLTFLVVLGGILLIATMIGTAISQVVVFRETGNPQDMLYSTIATALLFALLLAAMRSGTSNASTDADFLLSLPLRRSTILLSKSISRYLFDAAPLALFLLPSFVVYYVMVDHSVGMLMRGLFVTLLMPMASVGFAYLVAYLLFIISGKFARPEMIRTAFTLLVAILFMVFYFMMTGSMGFGGNMQVFVNAFPPLAWGGRFVADGNMVALALFLLVSVLPFGLGIAVQARIYGQKQRVWRSSSRTLDFTAHAPLRSLFNKELKFYFSVPIYVTNTIFAPAMAILFAIVLVIGRDAVFSFLMSDPDLAGLGDATSIIVVAVLCFFPAMTSITASSISLEGKHIRILRASPLDEVTVFQAKIFVHLLMIVPVITLCAVAVGWAVSMPILAVAALVLMLAALSILVALWGLYINLVFPKLEWDSEVTVVKQSASMMIAVFSAFVPMLLPLGIYFVFGISIGLTCLLSFVIFATLSGLLWLLLLHDGRRRYREL